MPDATDPFPALVRHVAGLRFEDMPPEAVAAAKTFLIDTFGVGAAGTVGANLEGVIRAAEAWGRGEAASVWGRDLRLPPASAAFVNAYQIHSLEFDCVHEPAVLHPMSSVLSAAMAAAEARSAAGRPVTGRELIAACAAGVDVACFLGAAARGPVRFFRPAVAGGFGAVAAVAKISGFDEARTADAFGIQYGQTSGTMQPHVEGSPLLGLQVGFAARSGVASCDLVAAGLGGPRDVFTGRYGYFRLIEDDLFDTGPGLAELGRVFQIARLSHKPWPTGRLTHGIIDGLRQLQSRHGFAADEVAAVECRVPPLVHRLVGRPDVPEPAANYAKLCIPFIAATVLRFGDVEVGHFLGKAVLDDPLTHAIAQRVTVEDDGNPDPNAMTPQHLRVRLASGTEHALDIPHMFGHPERPMSAQENLSKFRRAWAGATALSAAQGEALAAALADCETLPDAAALAAFLRPA